MEILYFLTLSLCNIACFMIGAKVGQQVARGESVEMPPVNPMEAVRRHEAKREARQQQDRLDAIMGNLEAYDGTGNGQKEVPRR